MTVVLGSRLLVGFFCPRSAECRMFLLLFVQLNKQKNNKTQTLHSVLLCCCLLEGQDRVPVSALLAHLSRGMRRLPCARGLVLLWLQVCFGCRGSPGQPVVPQLGPCLLPQSREQAGRCWGGRVAGAARAFIHRDFGSAPQTLRELQPCYRELRPAGFPTSAPQRAGHGGRSGHGRSGSAGSSGAQGTCRAIDTRNGAAVTLSSLAAPRGCTRAARHNRGTVNRRIHQFTHRGEARARGALRAALRCASPSCPSTRAAQSTQIRRQARAGQHAAPAHVRRLPLSRAHAACPPCRTCSPAPPPCSAAPSSTTPRARGANSPKTPTSPQAPLPPWRKATKITSKALPRQSYSG